MINDKNYHIQRAIGRKDSHNKAAIDLTVIYPMISNSIPRKPPFTQLPRQKPFSIVCILSITVQGYVIPTRYLLARYPKLHVIFLVNKLHVAYMPLTRLVPTNLLDGSPQFLVGSIGGTS